MSAAASSMPATAAPTTWPPCSCPAGNAVTCTPCTASPAMPTRSSTTSPPHSTRPPRPPPPPSPPPAQAPALAAWGDRFFAGLHGAPVDDPVLPAVLHTVRAFDLEV